MGQERRNTMLQCPVCKKTLKKQNQCYQCENRHSFDIAKQGYTNLYMKSSKNSGDNREMVIARTNFLSMDYYRPLCEEIISLIQKLPHDVIVDAGCGEGYYTKQISENCKCDMYAFDLSKEALKHASRQDKRSHYFLNSIFDLPIQSHSVDLILNLFAPLAVDEFERIIKKEGYLIKVDPDKNHLYQMKEFLYDTTYENEILNLHLDNFRLLSHKKVCYRMNLAQDALKALIKMTPYYYRTKKDRINALLQQESMCIDAAFIIYLYQKK